MIDIGRNIVIDSLNSTWTGRRARCRREPHAWVERKVLNP